VRDQIRDKLPFVFEDAGEHEVKNIARPVRVYKLAAAAIEALPESKETGLPQEIRRRSVVGRPIMVAAAALGCLVIVAGAFWSVRPDTSPSATVISATAAKAGPAAPLVVAVAPSAALERIAAHTAPRMSIVVLPFTNLSGDPGQEYFANGFTESLTSDLSRISGSFVIARNTAYTYKGKALSEKQIASDLGVRYVLEGGVQKAGNHVRVNAELIDGETGGHLWVERYDRDGADFLQIQDEITHQIANALGWALTVVESERSWRDHPTNPDSLDLTLRADAMLLDTAKSVNADARRLYERAIELDGQNAVALNGLGETYIVEVTEDWIHGDATSEALKRADDATTRELSINPRSAPAYNLKSHIFAYTTEDDYRGELAPAIAAAETALEINPNRAGTLVWLGRLYAKAGHPERTAALIEQAIRLDPRNPHMADYLYTVGMAQLQMGHNDEAIDTFQRSVLLVPNKIITWAGLTGAFIAAGREVEAQRALLKWREVAAGQGGYKLDYSPDKDVPYVRMQLALLRLGRWPYAMNLWGRSHDPQPDKNLSRALLKFQADEKLPQTGEPDEATLARLGITSQASASTSK
jgi:TolB-like protein/Flp pilus assembly protein TadD